jgi:hypothetical protein
MRLPVRIYRRRVESGTWKYVARQAAPTTGVIGGDPDDSELDESDDEGGRRGPPNRSGPGQGQGQPAQPSRAGPPGPPGPATQPGQQQPPQVTAPAPPAPPPPPAENRTTETTVSSTTSTTSETSTTTSASSETTTTTTSILQETTTTTTTPSPPPPSLPQETPATAITINPPIVVNAPEVVTQTPPTVLVPEPSTLPAANPPSSSSSAPGVVVLPNNGVAPPVTSGKFSTIVPALLPMTSGIETELTITGPTNTVVITLPSGDAQPTYQTAGGAAPGQVNGTGDYQVIQSGQKAGIAIGSIGK